MVPVVGYSDNVADDKSAWQMGEVMQPWQVSDSWATPCMWQPNDAQFWPAMGWGADPWCTDGAGVQGWAVDGWCTDGWDNWAGYPVAFMAPNMPGFTLTAIDAEEDNTARIHFGKTYMVLSEIIEKHPIAFGNVSVFLDFGCAPGGFSYRLLEEQPFAQGFGVTMPVDSGGFPMVFADERLRVTGCDLMSLWSVQEIGCTGEVDLCLADAQDLGRRITHVRGWKGAGRRFTGSGGKGVGATCPVLGIWALTLQEFALGFDSLREGGSFVFRFGWRGRITSEDMWYQTATHRLFALVFSLFAEVEHLKSEFSHQADSSFYIVASGFRRGVYTSTRLSEDIREAVKRVHQCERSLDLPWCVECLAQFMEPDVEARIEGLLDIVGKLRAIGLSSRLRQHDAGHCAECSIFITPVPSNLTSQYLRDVLEQFGKVLNIRRRKHAVGSGADAFVRFAQPTHATTALDAIATQQVLGPNVVAKHATDKQLQSFDMIEKKPSRET